ncbi:MAG TPA: hypothetical protein VN774_03255 [Candidatus Limnocylindrales bacterium]|nr:hypothetical protein [Candidatus Limnocylindrales bacterium]
MSRLQFRVLYRLFLFRVVDLELLSDSARGDASKLFGQFAALLIMVSLLLAYAGLVLGGVHAPGPQKMVSNWSFELFLISTTMLVVGLFTVLSWDSMFPDRRDVLMLAPLPVPARTFFLAKVAAVTTALGLAVGALHSFAGLAWPIALSPAHSGVLGEIRSFGAYWITMISAGAFLLCSLLCVQGLAALLPRQLFLRVSAFLQLSAFCLLLSVYFLQPTMVTPEELTVPRNQHLLALLPPYWFLGMFQTLNGSAHPALTPLAWRGACGLAIAVLGAGVAFLLSYFRTLRKIVEEPDIAPGARGGHWLPSFGDAAMTALVQFNIRTVFRSRQHRLILSFVLGLAFTVIVLYVKTPLAQNNLQGAPGTNPWLQANVPLLVSSIVMMWFAVIGTRMVFAMPIELRANWIFRTTNVRGVKDCLSATRRSLLTLAVAPVWMIWAGVLMWLWPLRPAAEHLAVLGLLGVILVEACLHDFHKIPFTCSYLPGKANVYHLFFLYAMISVFLLDGSATLELNSFRNTGQYTVFLMVMTFVAILMRRRTQMLARSDGQELRFEEEGDPAVIELGLN